MSKAEEKAAKLIIPKQVDDIEELCRFFYIKGYNQAEKDNELTWEDIEIIINAFLDFKIESVKSRETKKYTDKEYCVEVLKRFKERKEKCQ